MTWVSAMSVGVCENTEYGMSGNTSDGCENTGMTWVR